MADWPGDDVKSSNLRGSESAESQPMLFQLLRDQVPVGDLYLLLLWSTLEKRSPCFMIIHMASTGPGFINKSNTAQWVLDLEWI